MQFANIASISTPLTPSAQCVTSFHMYTYTEHTQDTQTSLQQPNTTLNTCSTFKKSNIIIVSSLCGFLISDLYHITNVERHRRPRFIISVLFQSLW